MRDLSLHILDLVQNSIEAGASQVQLDICEDGERDQLTISVRDNGRGMDEELQREVLDPFVTSRKTRKIGLGLPLIEMTTKQCGGSLTLKSTPGIGTLVQAVYRYSHIDRPPLGNMAATIRTIIVANPALDFRYCHQVGKKSLFIATREITEILGDVPLTQPEVLSWLDAYLQESLDNLYGGVHNENA